MRDNGSVMVTAVLLVAVMLMLALVAISSGLSLNAQSGRGTRWTGVLPVAEAGIDDAMVRISANRHATPASTGCPYDGASIVGCSSPGGQYQVTWQPLTRGLFVITGYGYYPTVPAYVAHKTGSVARRIQVTLGPVKSFQYALFSKTTIDVKNDGHIIGDIYAEQKITFGTNAILCGNVVNVTGGVDMFLNSDVTTSFPDTDCDSTANVQSGGTISSQGTIEGNATASAPTGTTCPPIPNTTFAILGGTVAGTATACGTVTASTPDPRPNTSTVPPVSQPLPTFTFDPSNYSDLTCFPAGGTCGPTNTSADAVAQFNVVSRTAMHGTYAVWQTNPDQSTKIDMSELTVGGDLTIITNAPIDLGNTGEITGTGGTLLALISLYIPPIGTSCTNNGGDCSIYGKNTVTIDAGDPSDPDDGIVCLMYTPGKMAFKNQNNSGEGSLFAGSMDLKNGFDISYNDRVSRIVGFGSGLQQILWTELKPP